MTVVDQLRRRSSLLTLNDLAELLACHPQTLYKACRAGKMPHIRDGGRIKFDPFGVAAYLERRSVGQSVQSVVAKEYERTWRVRVQH